MPTQISSFQIFFQSLWTSVFLHKLILSTRKMILLPVFTKQLVILLMLFSNLLQVSHFIPLLQLHLME
ncbi:unnamed protein product, partial [Hymenolepis diminuta]